jgi:hypothetical protein
MNAYDEHRCPLVQEAQPGDTARHEPRVSRAYSVRPSHNAAWGRSDLR